VVLRHPSDYTKHRVLEQSRISQIEPLLVPVLEQGKLIYQMPTIEQMREQRRADVARLDPGVRRLLNPHVYHVSLSEQLWQMKQELIRSLVAPVA
jgi:nicotinate phosphoribosyltransferase